MSKKMAQKLTSVGIIPDGNRRYSQKYNVSLLQSYQRGVDKAREAVKWLDNYSSVKTVTFYTLSLENLQRNKTELDILLKLFKRQIEDALKTDFFKEHDISPKFIGRTQLLPKDIQALALQAEESNNDLGRTINFAIAYNGNAEIVDASKKIAEEYKAGNISLEGLDEETFAKYLYSPSLSPELIFRTGDTNRLSGFLTYESSYSELYFTQKLWPEVTQGDFDKAVDYFESAQRKFGK